MDLVSVFHDTYQRTLNKSIKVCKIKQECIINDIEILNINCIDAIIKYKHYYPTYSIGLLNFANGMNRGGGVVGGARAQEEDICRTTNLYHTLLKVEYPIKSDEIIISKDVTLIKNSSYNLIDEINIDYVLSKDALVVRNLFDEIMYKETKRRIELIIETASSLNIDILILGAFGCGIFNNPPESIAYIFKQVLQKYKFKKVIFAILENGNKLNKTFENIFHT
jgi:uncharacterized protein (TIGR02452 family)